MNDNLEPLTSQLRKLVEQRAKNPRRRPPTRATFHRLARAHRPELFEDFDRLYHDCHWWWVLAKWKRELHWYCVSAEKAEAIYKAYSADSFPRLRDVVQHDNKRWAVMSVAYMGVLHPPLATAYMLLAEDYPIEPGPEHYYAGKVVTCKGTSYRMSSRKVMFYSEERPPEHTQEDLFA